MIDDPLSNRPDQCPPPKLEIVVDGDETTVESPACPLPHIPLTNNHLWKHVEVEARNTLQQLSITKQDVLRLFHMLPRSLMLGQAPNQYVVAGANPRCRMNILTLSRNLPFFTHCVNRSLTWLLPHTPTLILSSDRDALAHHIEILAMGLSPLPSCP